MAVATLERTGDAAEIEAAFAGLARATYLSLTTFRRDGTPVATPVWVVSDAPSRLLVATGAATGKVKRIRNNPQVRVAACTSRGEVRGPVFLAEATLSDDTVLVERLTNRKYRVMAPTIRALNSVARLIRRRAKAASLTVVITLPADRRRALVEA